MHAWKNERGVTLTELLAAVVILSTVVVVPLTNIGTAALTQHREAAQKEEALLLAQTKMQDIRREAEKSGPVLPAAKIKGVENQLAWSVKLDPTKADTLPLFHVDGQPISELFDVTLTVKDAEGKTLTELFTVVRKRVTP